MARYYFDVHDGAQLVRDEDGSEFENDDAAVQAAARSATEIGQGRVAKGDFREVVIEVRKARSRNICTVTASMKIEWRSKS
ncbi:hypothetical protein P7L87_26415 [Vibrio parahaemolyticus]|uniref:DUF6894 domain-containing protein n=1 Tax=Microvirga mediterraneensis TaxID=2754695 RepID=A0A838BMC0_9HYPH|nr:hypothetical protein [Microvirga mediterraneensis]MBA1156229.1 hypothetical protein [Microvirga mediterraneensis]MDG2571091.1 hypothetical protein [Vibrio parahaemolyticus]